MPGHLNDPFDPTDRCWYKKDNQPHTFKSLSPASLSSGADSFASPYSSRVPSSKSQFGTRSTAKTRSYGAPSTSIAADIGNGHTSRANRRQHGRDTRQEPSAHALADASNSLPRLDPDDSRRRKMHIPAPSPGQQRDIVLLQGTAGTPPNTARRGRKNHDQRPTRRSSSTPAGGNSHTRNDAMLGWHPTQPLPPGESWYIRRRDPPHPKSKLDAKINENLKPTRRRRVSSGSATFAVTRPANNSKGTGVMRGWYAAVCKRLGVAGADSDSEIVRLLKSEN